MGQVGIFPWSKPMPHNHGSVGQGGAVPLTSITGHVKAPHDALAINADQVDGVDIPNTPANILNPRDISVGCVVSDNIRKANDTEQSNSTIGVMTKEKEIRCDEATGALRIKWQHKRSGGTKVYSRVYINGAPVGTEKNTTSTTYVDCSEDIGARNLNDLIQIYATTDDGGTVLVANMKVCYDKGLTHIGGETLGSVLIAGDPYAMTNQDP